MKILGVDFGDARTGVAISDELEMLARGVKTIFSYDIGKTALEIAEIIDIEGAKRLVVGLPRNMDGSEGGRAEKTRIFIDELKKHTDLEIIEWDERLTTVSAARTLNELNIRSNERKKVIDTVSAVIILQNYLDRK
jgi:putative Holliday junction resolvase